jgi:parvulin-like peptidyl-prolyl isomerase
MKRKIFNRLFIFGLLALLLFWVPKLFSESETILAKIGKTVITQSDLNEYMEKMAQLKKGDAFSSEDKKVLLDSLVRGAIITMEAEKEKLDQKPEIKSKLNIFRSDLLIQEYVNTKIQPFAAVTDKEIDEKFKGNPNLLPKETLTLKEIVVKTEKEAESIYKELKKGEDFSKLASEKSVAPSKTKGGQMRPISKGYLPKDLEEVAFNLKKGEFSKPIKTEEGFYILYLVERKERSPEELKRLEGIIKEKIKKIEESRKLEAMIEMKVEELKKDTKIEVYYNRIQ